MSEMQKLLQDNNKLPGSEYLSPDDYAELEYGDIGPDDFLKILERLRYFEALTEDLWTTLILLVDKWSATNLNKAIDLIEKYGEPQEGAE